MNRRFAPALFVAALVAVLSPSLRAADLTVGEPFPIVKLPLCGDDARSASIQSFRGRKIMLHLFASW